jgi:hypothetical protein
LLVYALCGRVAFLPISATEMCFASIHVYVPRCKLHHLNSAHHHLVHLRAFSQMPAILKMFFFFAFDLVWTIDRSSKTSRGHSQVTPTQSSQITATGQTILNYSIYICFLIHLTRQNLSHCLHDIALVRHEQELSLNMERQEHRIN